MDTLKNDFLKICEVAEKENVQVELMITGGESLKLGYQKRKLEKFEASQNQMAGFRVVDGFTQGYAYTENLSLDSLKLTFFEALKNAKTLKDEKTKSKIKFAEQSKIRELPFLNQAQDISMDEKLKVAATLESAALDFDPKIQSTPYCGLIESNGSKRILNSEGLDVSYKSSSYSGYTYSLAKDGESLKTNSCSRFVRDFKKLDAKLIAEKSAQDSIRALPAKKIKTGNYPVLIDKEEMSSFLGMLAPHLTAKNVLEGKSLLKGKLSQKLASPLFHLLDDPFHESGTASRPFDSEGSASQKTRLFESGTFMTFLTDIESSEKLGLKNTANASRSPSTSLDVDPSNLVVQLGQTTFDEMIRKYPQVVHITQVTGGLHAGYKQSTGDFSLPCEGFLFEFGKVVGPVDQFVISGNILQFLEQIEAVGTEYGEEGSSYLSPDLLIKSLSFAGEA